MGARRREPATDPKFKDVWVCEACHEAAYGPNPPDECARVDCGHRFFDNLHDLLAGRPTEAA